MVLWSMIAYWGHHKRISLELAVPNNLKAFLKFIYGVTHSFGKLIWLKLNTI
jgi:hypothetical protein